MMWGRICILPALLITIAADCCNKEDCETGISVGAGLASTCATVGGAICAITGQATFGLSCVIDQACGMTAGVEDAFKEACRACSTNGIGAGRKAERFSNRMNRITLSVEQLLDQSVKLEGQIHLTKITAYYGHAITNYQKVRKAFKQLTKPPNGLIIRNLDADSFERASNNAFNGVAASSMQIFQMMTGGHPMKAESIFQAIPNSCKHDTKDYVIKVMIDCYILESVSRAMKGEIMNPARVVDFKKQLILIEDQYIKDCGCPEGFVQTVRKSNLQFSLESLARSLPAGHCSSNETYSVEPVSTFIMDDSTDRVTLKKINLLYSAAPFTQAKSAAAKAIAETHRIEELMLAQYLSTSHSSADLKLFEGHLFCTKPGSFSSMLTAMFGLTLVEKTGLLKLEEKETGCVNSDQFWPYVWGRPGRACGLPGGPTLPKPAFLNQALQRKKDIRCSDPRPCSSPDCDPFLSFFKTKESCNSTALLQPDIRAWDQDSTFADHFLHGANPMVIRRVRRLEELRQELRGVRVKVGSSYQQDLTPLITSGKLFMADYSDLDSLPLNRDFVFYSPQVLLALDPSGSLQPLAILLRTDKLGVQTHLLTPENSPPGRWLFAKMHVANADAQVHEFLHHLPTHFILEAVALASHNWLGEGPSSHPLGQLLAPHFQGTIFINWLARHTLVKGSGSIVDAIFSVGRDGALDLSKRHVNFTSLHFPDMMEERGFPEVRASLGLSGQGGSQLDWKFRDDGYSLWGALARYMEAVVVRIYTSDLALARDTALQRWAQSIGEEGNLPGFPTQLNTRAELARTLTMIVFGASVQHTALNDGHYLYSYAPHRPTLLKKWMPSTSEDLPWSWLLTALPSLQQAAGAYSTTNLLSMPTPCNLLPYMKTPGLYPDLRAQLAKDLQQISGHIQKREHSYGYLDPQRVHCSINI